MIPKKLILAAGILICSGHVAADRPAFWPDNVRSEMIETATIEMQVYRAGESGMPIVVMQDMHDYFDPDPKWADPEARAGWIARGSGHRDFVARLAGHHPERTAAMILLEGMAQPLLDVTDPDVFAFASGWWRGARDIADTDERIDQLTMERLGGYVPAFLTDSNARVSVPTLYLGGPPAFEGQWMWSNLYRFDFAPYPHGADMVEDFWGDYYQRIQPFLERIAAEPFPE